MAVDLEGKGITDFDQWYVDRRENDRTGCLEYRAMGEPAAQLRHKYDHFKREMDARCYGYDKLEMLADGEVISPKADLPNVSSGETAGIVRRIARNLVQNTPNVEVLCAFDDDSLSGVLAKHILTTRIIGTDQYSNDMQQNLFASTKSALTLGFDCVVPVLQQDASGTWMIKYDTIHFRDVFPEPGAKDVRDSNEVFVRRYLTSGEIKQLIRNQVPGWDIAALREILRSNPRPPARDRQSNSHQDNKRKVVAEGYEIVTWYNAYGQNFLTFSPPTMMLLRIEHNKHPLNWHPVFFLILEKDNQHALGKSQVELLLGRQEFQDLMHNGAMKLWYRNINPSIIGYGTVNSIPNLSPGKYTQIANPNAKIEPFEVNTQTLMQYIQIAQANLGSMVTMVGAADQQMATQAGNGMSATPQGVEAQQKMVDITTNNYQKAIESFISHYCSYALTIYFQELKGVKSVTPSADARLKLLAAGVEPEAFEDDGSIKIDFADMAVEYWVRCVPGSLVEMEDEKQLRILNELFVPLSQALPAIVQTQDRQMINNAAQTMAYIIEEQIRLSGSSSAGDLQKILKGGRTEELDGWSARADTMQREIGGVAVHTLAGLEASKDAIQTLQEQMKIMAQTQQAILEKLGVGNTPNTVMQPPVQEVPPPQQPVQQPAA